MAFEPHKLPFVGQYFDDPNQQALTAQFQQMADAYKMYRGFAADTRESELGTQLQNMQPSLDMLYRMYPSMQKFDTQGAYDQFANTADRVKQNSLGVTGVTGGRGPAAAVSIPVQTTIAKYGGVLDPSTQL